MSETPTGECCCQGRNPEWPVHRQHWCSSENRTCACEAWQHDPGCASYVPPCRYCKCYGCDEDCEDGLRAALEVQHAKALRAAEERDRARAALSAAEKREARLREALAKYWTGCRKCASWLGTDGPVTPAGSWFRGCDACRELREAYRATKAALEGASAASDPKGPPDSSAVVPGAQEGEK